MKPTTEGCTGKNRYTTKYQADKIAHIGNVRHEKTKLQSYKCQICGMYHIGEPIVDTFINQKKEKYNPVLDIDFDDVAENILKLLHY